MDDQAPFDVVMVRAEVKVPAGTDPAMVPGALEGLDCGTRLGLFEFGDVVLDGSGTGTARETTEEGDNSDH